MAAQNLKRLTRASNKSGAKSTSKAQSSKSRTARSSRPLSSPKKLEKQGGTKTVRKRAVPTRNKAAQRATATKTRASAQSVQPAIPLSEQAWFRPVSRAIHESLLLFILGSLIFLLLSLSSYNPQDGGFSQVGHTDTVTNLAGKVGAWVADFLHCLLGLGAFWLIVVWGYALYWWFPVAGTSWSWPLFIMRTLGFFSVLVSMNGLLTMYWLDTAMPMSSGGILGLEVSGYLTQLFGDMGATVVLSTVLFIGVSFVFDVSWWRLVASVGRSLGSAQRNVALVATEHWRDRHDEMEAASDENPVIVKSKPKITKPNDDHKTTHGQSKDELDLVNSNGGLSYGLLNGIQVVNQTADRLKRYLSKRKQETAVGVVAVRESVEPGIGEFGDLDESNKNEDRREPVIANLAIVKEPLPEREIMEAAQKPIENKPKIVNTKPKKMSLRRKKASAAEPIGELPPLSLLDPVRTGEHQGFTDQDLQNMSQLLELKLRDFNIEAAVEAVIPGPVVTRFEIQPAPGIKVSRITNLAKDLARSLAVISVRVVEVIPGKTTVGIEIPNRHREMISLGEVISSTAYANSKSPLTLCLGKDIAGQSVTADLAKMPHLLVAGTTGSGKSVGLNAMLISMLFKSSPEHLRMIMIDPKMLELSVYDDIPHLLTPVVTDMKEAANSLRWCVAEMERRYRLMASLGVRNLAGYNRKVQEAAKAGEPLSDPLWVPSGEPPTAPPLQALPNIVVVIDEFADMMMIVGKKVEELIARIAQKARAAGIHLILATQRPSVDVITGLIKANVPARIAFQVSSKVDSRTILDQGGAEQLLGSGDMLYLPPGTGLPLRVHGAFVADEEVHRVCDDWRARGQPDYLEEILEGSHESGAAPGFEPEQASSDPEGDPLYDQAVHFVTQTRKASISAVQRKFKIGYNRAARMVESMEAAGVVSPTQNNGQREVIAPPPV